MALTDLPPVIVDAINLTIKKFKGEIRIAHTVNSLIHIYYKQYPDLSFTIWKQNRDKYEVSYNPSKYTQVEMSRLEILSTDVGERLAKWAEYLSSYEDSKHIEAFDIEETPIFKQSQEEIIEWFQVDDSDDVKAYDTQTQFKIEEFTNKVVELIEMNPDLIDEIDKGIILNHAKVLLKKLPVSTRSEVKKDIAKFGALVKKGSITLFKEFVKELIKEGVKLIMKEENIKAFIG